ncbi:MAG: hypothetical protein ACPHK8_02635 [Thermoplasmatota archaeon]
MLEGATHLRPPEGLPHNGPGTIGDAPFFNPAMALNRDLSVLAVEAYAKARGRGVDFADVLAGTGARSVRIANEVAADVQVIANDAHASACDAVRETAARNHVEVEVSNQNAHAFLAERRFDLVDIDPFGSPMPFVDAALNATRHNGLLFLTATDTAALSGTFKKACRRRYGAEPFHGAPWRAEAGLRILAACGVRSAGRHDRAATPIMCVSHQHWMRVVFRVQDGRSRADALTKQIAGLQVDERGAAVRGAEAGPFYWGPLHEQKFIDEIVAAADRKEMQQDRTKLFQREAAGAPFWVPMEHLANRFGTDMKRRDPFMAQLPDAAPTHMEHRGVRTNATMGELQAAWDAA